MATTPYDLSGEAFLQPPSNEQHTLKLAGNTGETLKIPSDARIALFSCSDEFWVSAVAAEGTLITVPSADIKDGTSPRRSPGGFLVEGHQGQWLSCVSPYGTNLQVTFYS